MLLATLKIVSCLRNCCYHDHDNRHIVKLLSPPQSLCQNVLTEFEYQLEFEFSIFTESTILVLLCSVTISPDFSNKQFCKLLVPSV